MSQVGNSWVVRPFDIVAPGDVDLIDVATANEIEEEDYTNFDFVSYHP